MATSILGVTAAMVKEEIQTSLSDADIESIAQKKEYRIAKRYGLTSAPSDTTDLNNYREMVILLTRIAIKNMDPHSRAIGPYREEHYPQLSWTRELKELYAMYDEVRVSATAYQTEQIADEWGES
jgi:hypothetical protein